MIANDAVEVTYKESVVACYKVLSHDMLGETE
jgi:hypothetical protein